MDDLDDFMAPPLPGKAHPPQEMSDAVPTADDDRRRPRYHPSDAASVEFESDPEAADAAADMATDLGAEFLEGATRGRDLSDIIAEQEEEMPNEIGLGEATEYIEPETADNSFIDIPPAKHSKKHPSPPRRRQRA